MSDQVTIEITSTTTTRTTITPLLVAEMIAALDDEQQAQVFIELAQIAATWTHRTCMQWFSVGRHLRNCACSTEEARDLVRDIASGIESST